MGVLVGIGDGRMVSAPMPSKRLVVGETPTPPHNARGFDERNERGVWSTTPPLCPFWGILTAEAGSRPVDWRTHERVSYRPPLPCVRRLRDFPPKVY